MFILNTTFWKTLERRPESILNFTIAFKEFFLFGCLRLFNSFPLYIMFILTYCGVFYEQYCINEQLYFSQRAVQKFADWALVWNLQQRKPNLGFMRIWTCFYGREEKWSCSGKVRNGFLFITFGTIKDPLQRGLVVTFRVNNVPIYMTLWSLNKNY